MKNPPKHERMIKFENPMSVVMTANSAWNIWNFRRPIVSALISSGYTVTILAPPDEYVKNLESMGCRFMPLVLNAKSLNPLRELALCICIWKCLKEIKPRVVLSYTIKNNIFGALAARLLGIPILPNVSGLGTAFLSGGILRIVAKTLYKVAFTNNTVVFFQNNEDRKLFIDLKLVNPIHARILPGSGIDLEQFAYCPLPSDGGSINFLMVARLLRDKGVFEYVEAAKYIRQHNPNVRFQLLGPADSLNRNSISRQVVERWASEGVIDYLGAQQDVRPFISNVHCVVLPTFYPEGTPRSLLEAAAMGRPVITTDTAGCRTVVNEAVSGFLCEPRNVGSLVSALKQFLTLDDVERRKMGKQGRQRMENIFDQRIVVEQYMRAISDVLAPPKI